MERYVNSKTPVADHVTSLLDAAKVTYVVIQACDLMLFDEVQKSGGITAKALAQKKDWEEVGLRRLMDSIVAFKLFSKSTNANGEDVYKNTEEGKLLIKDGPPALHEYAMAVNDDIGSIKALAKTIRKDTSPAEDKGGDEGKSAGEAGPSSIQAEDVSYTGDFPPAFWINVYRMCDGIGAPYADTVATVVDLSKHKTCVDLGGGSGCFSRGLLKAYPDMKVVIAELPNTLPIVEEHFLSKNSNPRLSTVALDYNKDSMPSADLYLLANVVHDLEPEKCKELLTKIHKALNPGGGILLVEQLLNDRRDGPPNSHVWDLAFYGMAQMYTGKELADILNECGYCDVQIVKTQDACICDMMYASKN